VQERYLSGLEYLNTITRLLQCVRQADPTAGLLEAVDLQWWWRSSRSTDSLPQLFWFSDTGKPQAALIATDWGESVALDPIAMPNVNAKFISHMLDRGIAHAKQLGLSGFEVVVDHANHSIRDDLSCRGFIEMGDSPLCVTDAWLSAVHKPDISQLPEGYQLLSRNQTRIQTHHMAARNGAEIEQRLTQTSLYNAELDLVVLDRGGAVAAYGLFWLDPINKVGLVEPMRTELAHRQRGLARHVLAVGIDRLCSAGASRIKLCFKPENLAAKHLYLRTGFQPNKKTVAFVANHV
jgi:predicted N-acetyltransferase YhbS